jgi:hypothetical protein
VVKISVRIFILVLSIIFLCGIKIQAEDSDYEAACLKECSFLTKDCTAYLECRVAKTTCMSDCMQRKVLEKVATAIDKLTVVLEKQGKEKEQKEEAVPLFSAPNPPAGPKATDFNLTTGNMAY